MQLPIYARFKTICSALPFIHRTPGIKALYVLDTISLILFATIILGIVNQLPTLTNVVIQPLFVATIVLSTILFLGRRAFGMVILKIFMLAIIYFMADAVYFI